MTRFLHITDTHLGVVPGRGWALQRRDPRKLGSLMECLRGWLTRNPIDFVLHGGDATEDGTPAQIGEAVDQLAALGPPAYLCLGNHDLSGVESIRDWRRMGASVLPGGRESFVVRREQFDLYVLAHHWNRTDPPHHWDKTGQTPRIDAQQQAALEEHLRRAERPVILAVHAPVADIPPEQTGHAQPFHPPDPEWRATIVGLIRRHRSLRMVITGHNHANSLHYEDGRAIVSTAAFAETPFEARLIEVDADAIHLQTLCFRDLLGIEGDYDLDKSWVQGGEAQRRARIPLRD